MLALGGNNLTNDISIGLRAPTAEAEKIKKKYGTCLSSSIAADDTIHFVTRCNKELVLSQDFNTAISSTFRTCGRALFYTTMTLSLGFSIFMLSSFGPLKNGGRLSLPPVIVAFVADMIIFPALLLTFRPSFMKKKFFV